MLATLVAVPSVRLTKRPMVWRRVWVVLAEVPLLPLMEVTSMTSPPAPVPVERLPPRVRLLAAMLVPLPSAVLICWLMGVALSTPSCRTAAASRVRRTSSEAPIK